MGTWGKWEDELDKGPNLQRVTNGTSRLKRDPKGALAKITVLLERSVFKIVGVPEPESGGVKEKESHQLN